MSRRRAGFCPGWIAQWRRLTGPDATAHFVTRQGAQDHMVRVAFYGYRISRCPGRPEHLANHPPKGQQ